LLALALFHDAKERLPSESRGIHRSQRSWWHAGDDVGFLVNGDALFFQSGGEGGDVAGAEVDVRAGAVLFRAFAGGEIEGMPPQSKKAMLGALKRRRRPRESR